MAYNKKIWANGDLITKERMNNIEDGIYDAHDKIEENTTNTNTARQDISDIKLQIGTEELTTTSKKIKGAINELSSQIKEIVNNKATKQELEVERGRIDSFTSLAEGSTTGDAELIDGRIGYDGKSYSNLGNAIRSQFKNIIDGSINKYDNQLNFNKEQLTVSPVSANSSDTTLEDIIGSDGYRHYIISQSASNALFGMTVLTVYRNCSFLPNQKFIMSYNSTVEFNVLFRTFNNSDNKLDEFRKKVPAGSGNITINYNELNSNTTKLAIVQIVSTVTTGGSIDIYNFRVHDTLNLNNINAEVDKKIDNINTKMDNINLFSYKLKDYNSPYDVESGGINTDGSLTNWNWTQRKRYDCNEDCKIIAINVHHDTTTPLIAFYDESNSFISAVYSDTTNLNKWLETFAPKGTKYFYLCITNGFGTPDNHIEIYEKELSNITWYNRKIASALGDSNTQGGYYYYYIKNELGLSSYKNCGISGSGFVNGDDAMYKDTRINSLDINSNIITIMGGTNDVNHADNIKEEDFTIENHDTSTFVGAYNVALSKIYYKYLKVAGYYSDVDYSGVQQVETALMPNEFVLLLIAPPFRFDGAEYDYMRKVKKINDAVKRIASMWGLPCVDATITGLNDMTKNIWWNNSTSKDMLHPPARWHRVLARLIISKLKEIEPLG